MKVIALCNQKGGVGKSTLTYHLAATLAQTGHRILVIDADPQGNLTLATAANPTEADDIGLADVLTTRSDTRLTDVITPTHFPGVDLIPTTGEALTMLRDELVIAGAGRESRLREALATLQEDYDVILIDCPPSLDQLTINALVAATNVLVVTHARLWSSQGLSHLLENVQLVQTHYNPDLEILGITINQIEPRTKATQHWTTKLNEYAKERNIPVLWPAIPKRAMIADTVETSTRITNPELRRIFTALANKLVGNSHE